MRLAQFSHLIITIPNDVRKSSFYIFNAANEKMYGKTLKYFRCDIGYKIVFSYKFY